MVLVFGTICLDRVRNIEALPQPGGYAGVTSETVFLGGEAANTANALKTWGMPIEFAGNLLGESEDAHALMRLIIDKGIPTQRIKMGAGITPVCDIYVTPDGERTMFGVGFDTIANHVDVEALPFEAGHWFTADMNLGASARQAVGLARERGMRIYLMDFLAPNEAIQPEDFWQSSTDWVGSKGNTQKNVEWVRKFVAAHGCFTVLSDGPNGLVAGSPDMKPRAFPPFPAPTFVDSTGAGDMFRAGMLFGLDSGWDVMRSLAFASAAGCLKCQYLGATSHVPTRDEIEEHISANPDVARHYA